MGVLARSPPPKKIEKEGTPFIFALYAPVKKKRSIVGRKKHARTNPLDKKLKEQKLAEKQSQHLS